MILVGNFYAHYWILIQILLEEYKNLILSCF
jgi:hypothetical protein